MSLNFNPVNWRTSSTRKIKNCGETEECRRNGEGGHTHTKTKVCIWFGSLKGIPYSSLSSFFFQGSLLQCYFSTDLQKKKMGLKMLSMGEDQRGFIRM